MIRPALARGEVVVSDRFLLANVVYQGHAGQLSADALWKVGTFATGGLEPDLTLILQLSPDIAVARRNREADRIEERGEEFYTRVHIGFTFEGGRRPERHCFIDAAPDTDAVQKAIRSQVSRLLTDHGWNVQE